MSLAPSDAAAATTAGPSPDAATTSAPPTSNTSSSSSSSSSEYGSGTITGQQISAISATELLGTMSSPNISSNNGKVEVKLFVGRLPRTIEEHDLTPLFAAFGDVVETIIIRDKATGQHKGSAFIKMASLTQADAAVRMLHNTKVIDAQLGPIQVKYASGEPERLGLSIESAQPGSDLGKLFVGSLPKGVAEQEVREIFEKFGLIDEIVLMRDGATGQSKGCAFVKFSLKEQAIQAIKALHGVHSFHGCPRPLEVKFAENRRAVLPQMATMPYSAAAGVRAYPGAQQQHPGGGAMMGVHPGQQVQPPPSNLNPRSFGGWTEYFNPEGRPYYHSPTKGTQWLKPLEFEGLVTPPPAPMGLDPMSMASGIVSGGADNAGPPGANVFVFHIPNEWGQNEVIAQFGVFGRVLSCFVATDKATGRNKGYGFVSYDNIQSAATAVANMNGYPVGSKRLKVSIKSGEESHVAHLMPAQPPQQMMGTGANNAPMMSMPGAGGMMPGGPMGMPPGGMNGGYGPVGLYGGGGGPMAGYNPRPAPY